jgi:O-antigen ligase
MPDAVERWLPTSLRPGPERAVFLLLALAVAFSWLRLQRRFETPPWPAVAWPLALFFVWTVAAAVLSPDVRLGLTIVKKFALFLILFAAPPLLRGEGRVPWCYRAVFAAAAAGSVAGIAQYAWNPHRDLLNRITGLSGGWMTFSGVTMIALVMLAAYTVAYGVRNWWTAALSVILVASLYLSYTRNAWVGAVVGVTVVFALRRPRSILVVLAVVAALYLAAPSTVGRRLSAAWNAEDTTTRGRLELVSTSLRLIRDHPWFGVGPKTVNTEALRYRGTSEFPDWLYQHMHNNFLQLAAERGLPGLAFWLWFMIALAAEARRVLRSVPSPAKEWIDRDALVASASALGAWTALMVSGLFEYNFGDSEVLTLFLFVMSAPRAFSGAARPEPPVARAV